MRDRGPSRFSVRRRGIPLFVGVLFATALLWAKARDPFHREWLSLRTSSGQPFSAIAVMPDHGGPFPVVVWCHGSGGSLESSGETLRQFAALGLAAVGFEYDMTNQAAFDAQFAAVLDELERKPWAKANQTRTPQRGARHVAQASLPAGSVAGGAATIPAPSSCPPYPLSLR